MKVRKAARIGSVNKAFNEWMTDQTAAKQQVPGTILSKYCSGTIVEENQRLFVAKLIYCIFQTDYIEAWDGAMVWKVVLILMTLKVQERP